VPGTEATRTVLLAGEAINRYRFRTRTAPGHDRTRCLLCGFEVGGHALDLERPTAVEHEVELVVLTGSALPQLGPRDRQATRGLRKLQAESSQPASR
jgi:hypothetical protein